MEDKVICCCYKVSVNDIKTKISEGVTTFEELQEQTKIGTSCPPCGEDAKKVFDQLLNA